MMLFLFINLKQRGKSLQKNLTWQRYWISGLEQTNCLLGVHAFNSLTSSCFRGFSEKKTLKRTWLCARISLVRYALQT